MDLDWKKALIFGLGILLIVLIYYSYRNYEGFQSQPTTRTVDSDTFVGSSALISPYRFNRSLASLRVVYDDILDTITNSRSFTGIGNSVTYSYNSRFYNKFITINDFSLDLGSGRFWFPYTGQYGSNANWLSNFASETDALVNLDVYNSNIDRYKNFVRTGVGENRQKFLFKRSMARPSLLYSNIQLAFPDPRFHIYEPGTTNIAERYITEVRNFDSNTQSWFTQFTSYAKPNQNLYPPSDYQTDTAYKVLYGNPKPPNKTYNEVTNGKKAGTLVARIPDYTDNYSAIMNEELNLNVYGTLLPAHQTDFQECMFWGSVFTNFNDQTIMETVLNIPYNGKLNGSELFYSFNLFEPEIRFNYNIATKKYSLLIDSTNIDYNSKLISFRSVNQIRKLTDEQIIFDGFKNNVITNAFNAISREPITSSTDAYVGQVTSEIMAKVPSMARRFITSWTYNRTMRYLSMKPLAFTGVTGGLSTTDLSGINLINSAEINSTIPANSFTLFLNTYASYYDNQNRDKIVRGNFTISVDASIPGVNSEEACKRIVAGNRIYNTYSFNTATKVCQLSKTAPTGIGSSAAPLQCGTLFTRTLGLAWSATPAVVESVIRKSSTFKSLVQDTVQVISISLASLINILTLLPIDSIVQIKQGLTNPLISSNPLLVGVSRTHIESANISLLTVSRLNNAAKTVADSIVSLFNSEKLNDATILLNTLVNLVGKITNPTPKNISSITYTSGTAATATTPAISATLTINIGDVTNFEVGDLVEIKGYPGTSNNYNGTNYRIISVASPNITVSTAVNYGNITTSGGTVSVYSIYTYLSDANSSVNSISGLATIPTAPDVEKTAVKMINRHIVLCKSFTNFYKDKFTKFIDGIKSIQSATKAVNSINNGVTPTITDAMIKAELDIAISDVSGSKDISSAVTDITTIRDQAPVDDPTYDLLKKNLSDANLDITEAKQAKISIAEGNLNRYLYNVPNYTTGNRILTALLSYGFSSSSSGALTALLTALQSLKDLIGTGSIANVKTSLTKTELLKMNNDYNDAIYKNRILPEHGNLSKLNITDESFLNSIAQFYYEKSDGLYEMTAIYDVYTVGTNMVDIRFDKKQRLPNSRINNLTIQYLPQVKEYNRLLDIMDDGSWIQFYRDSNYTTTIPGQVLKKDAIDFYYEDLSAARNALQPILNPVYPVNININVKDLQTQLSNYINSNNTITKILTGKLSGPSAPIIAETATTVGLNYTDRLNTIQYELQEKINTIETQISGVLQSCARVFIHSISTDHKKWAIDGMALGIQAALTYNKAYNGNFEIDMGAPYGNIGFYQPYINYTKNLAPPIVCGDLQFIKKAASLFNQTAFLNLSSFTTKITGDDVNKRQGDTNKNEIIRQRSSNFYDSNNGPVFVDKILGFQQVNSNTCYYRWVETQYDYLTNGPFFDPNTNKFIQRIKNVQYQFTYDNSEYQNPQLLPDNNATNIPNQGFKYLPDSSNIQFGDLYMSLYSWYASATRDLYTYLNSVNTELNIISNSQYSQIISNYNLQNSNISNYNVYQTQFTSTNLVIREIFSDLVQNTNMRVNSSWEDSMPRTLGGVTYRPININGYVAKTCDSITITPPTINEDLVSVRYNFRPGDANNNTAYDNGSSNVIYNRYRDVPLSYFVSTVVLGPSINLNGSGTTTNTEFGGYTVHNNLYQEAYQCPRSVELNNPANCFKVETDRCKYQYTNGAVSNFSKIMSNIGIRDSLSNNILSLSNQMRFITVEVSTLMSNQINFAITNNIIEAAGYSQTQLYPIISKINDRITYLISDKSSTESNIASITNQYNTLVSQQRSDPNLRIYMSNREIPLTKILPEEAPYLDDENGACGPAYNCKSIPVIDQLLEQYNLDSNYDDTILRVLKAATPSKYQCDYLVEVRKKNVGIPAAVPVRYLRFIPIRQTVFDNRRTIYFKGSNFAFARIPVQVGNTDLDLGSNNFTIDWHQYSLFDGTNPTPVLFSIGNAIKVSYEIIDEDTLKFILTLNNLQVETFTFNYNQLNRWVYFAIVRNNNVLTCYKDGFAFISKVFQYNLNSLNGLNIFLGNDGTNRAGTFFKGGIEFFRYNNYDALYTGNFFNTIPRTPIKNINTRFIVQRVSDTDFDNTVRRTLTRSTSVQLSADPVEQITLANQTILTNGSYLRTLLRTDSLNSSIAFRINELYISDTKKHQIIKVNSNGTLSVAVGTGVAGRSSPSEFGQDPLLAALNSPTGICEGANNLYIADTGNERICMYNGTTLFELIYNISNVRHIAFYDGFLYYIYMGEIYRYNRLATPSISQYTGTTTSLINANLMNPNGICFDSLGNLYVANTEEHTIVKITVATGAVSIVAGQPGKATGSSNLLGDLGSPTSATLNSPLGVAVDSSNRILIADAGNKRLRIIMNSIIYTIVGDGTDPTDSLVEGYGSLVKVKPQSVITVGTSIYINDSIRICEVKEMPIPVTPPTTTYKYNFTTPTTGTIATTTQVNSISVGSDTDPPSTDFIFTKDFTIQWFMFMNSVSTRTNTVFSIENSSNTVLIGLSADGIANGVNISITIKGVNNTILFNRNEISSLWVHCALVLKGSVLSFYKNGVLIRSFPNTSFNYTENPVLTVGNRRNRSSLLNFYGYITNFNILNGVAMNYNNQIINYNIYKKPSPNLVVCLGVDIPSDKDYSLIEFSKVDNNTSIENNFPYSSEFIVSQINLYNSQNLVRSFSYNRNIANNYGAVLTLDIGSVVNINQFNFVSGNSLTRSVQQWQLLGSQDSIRWYEFSAQTLVPYVSRFGSNIYPKENSATELFSVNTQVNIGGDILTMTKSFKLARNIEDCTMVITSNVSYNEDGDAEYTPGVTSSNGFFIQDNTPYIEDSSGADISGYHFIGGALVDYNNLVKNSFDPVVDKAKSIQNTFFDAYSKSRLDTYAAIGKLNTTGFSCTNFKDYDTLASYMITNSSFTDTIFDSYPYSNVYMSNILRFAISDSNMIDIIFTKQNLTSNATVISYGDKTTAGARYKLSVSQGFCDLSATFISDILPFGPTIRNVNNPLFNEYPNNLNKLSNFDDLNVPNTRGKDYKDRLNQREKFLSGKRTPATTVTTSGIPTDSAIVQQLTGLRNIGSSNVVSAAENRVEYMLNNTEILPIGKRCFIVQYINSSEVNSVVRATVETTSFKKNIVSDPLSTLVNTFRTFFNSAYSIANNHPYNSIISKIYRASITNSILTLAVGIEYTKADNSIYYNKLPNISDFGTEIYYKVIFKNDGAVLAFEPTTASTLTDFTDGLTLRGGNKETYINKLLWTDMKFIPVSSSIVTSYSISQLEFYYNTTKVRIDSISVAGPNPTNFDLNNLIDGVNIQAQIKENVRFFTNRYSIAALTATFKNGAQINGFSFMTGYSYYNPQKWIVQGSCDGETFVQLINQNTIYGDSIGYVLSPPTIGYVSFYRTPIFSFNGLTPIPFSSQPRVITAIPEEVTEYSYIRIRADAKDLRYQLINISLFNNTTPVAITTSTSANTITYSSTGPTVANESLNYLFRYSNIDRETPIGVKMLEVDTSTTLTIQFTIPIIFNGLSFITGIDRDKCMLKWDIEVSANNTLWVPFLEQKTTYINDKINYPHYFCRTPIFYKDGLVIETDQIPLYKTLAWPIRYVRFKPIYMYGPYANELFELSQFEFFNSKLLNPKITPPTSSTNDNLIRTNIIGINDILPTGTSRTQIANLPNYRGSYFDSTNVVQFNFTSPINFDGFSFMSGSSEFTAVQLWTLEVSIDGILWAMVHSNEFEPAIVPNAYPSAYYRLPIIYFDKNIKIISDVKYYLITGDPSSPTNNGTLYPVNIYYSIYVDKSYISFASTDGTNAYTGILIKSSDGASFNSSISWQTFNNASNLHESNVYVNKTYPVTIGSPTATNQGPLYSFRSSTDFIVGIFNQNRPTDNPPIYRMTNMINPRTKAKLYVNTVSSSGAVIDTNSTIYLEQITGWTRPTTRLVQGFTNQTEYVKNFIVQTNKPFDISLFRLIGPNSKQIKPVFYKITKKNERFYLIQLNANIEVIGYSIRTTLYTNRSDPDSWKLYGMKKNGYLLLDKKEKVTIPNERSKDLVYYFNSKKQEVKKQVKEEVKEEVNAPDLKIIKNYYKSKINQFSNPEFKMYMFDGDKTYYILFDEYDNNKVLVGKNYIIGFVIIDGKIRKPVMYENGDGNYEAFDLSDKKVVNYWKKHIGLELRFTGF